MITVWHSGGVEQRGRQHDLVRSSRRSISSWVKLLQDWRHCAREGKISRSWLRLRRAQLSGGRTSLRSMNRSPGLKQEQHRNIDQLESRGKRLPLALSFSEVSGGMLDVRFAPKRTCERTSYYRF